MASYKALIFDFDGTLCATKDSILYSFEKTFAQCGVQPPTAQEVMAAVSSGANLPELLPLLHPAITSEELPHWVTTYRQIYSTEGSQFTTLFDGAEQLLQAAHQAGLLCIVISNKGQRAIEEALTQFNIASYFDFVVGDAPEVPLKKKPDPMAFQEIISPRYSHVQQSQFLMIGDTHADLGFANNAGIDACWAAFGYGNPQLCLQENPKFTIQGLKEVQDLI